mmetsp:Transcript_2472/g.8419  ORF Transcript_2472/g.8419 Transcript_2472/m.8419 type:complete len:206 (+) Transcript_2472:1319-1936(+)
MQPSRPCCKFTLMSPQAATSSSFSPVKRTSRTWLLSSSARRSSCLTACRHSRYASCTRRCRLRRSSRPSPRRRRALARCCWPPTLPKRPLPSTACGTWSTLASSRSENTQLGVAWKCWIPSKRLGRRRGSALGARVARLLASASVCTQKPTSLPSRRLPCQKSVVYPSLPSHFASRPWVRVTCRTFRFWSRRRGRQCVAHCTSCS